MDFKNVELNAQQCLNNAFVDLDYDKDLVHCPNCKTDHPYNHINSVWVGEGNDHNASLSKWIKICDSRGLGIEPKNISVSTAARCRELAICLMFECELCGVLWARSLQFHKGQYFQSDKVISTTEESSLGQIRNSGRDLI